MGQLDNQPENTNSAESGATESLKEVTRELENLKSTVLSQLSREIEQLQAKKARLLYETEQLELKRMQQLEGQQQLAGQIAPAIANQLQELLRQQLGAASGTEESPLSEDYNEKANRAIASLDSTLRATFRTLQQDLSSYQSALSQQLRQMHNLEQQGTTILETLVERLRQELETKMTAKASPSSTGVTQTTSPPHLRPCPPPRVGTIHPIHPVAPRPLPPFPEPPKPAPQPPKITTAQARWGLIFILIYSLALSLQNVVTRIILKQEPSPIFGGALKLGSYLAPSPGNSVLLLLLRMIFVMLGMLILAGRLYPQTWSEINEFTRSRSQNLWLQIAGSGFFFFLSQVLIYIALGTVSAGLALTIFFIFPIITLFLSWFLYGDRFNQIHRIATVAVFVGIALIVFVGQKTGITTIAPIGFVTSAGAGITFALQLLLFQTTAKRIHPVPLSIINFITILIFCILSLPLLQNSLEIVPQMRENILASGFILGCLSLLSYWLSHIGVKLIGGDRASLFSATIPSLTTLISLFMIGEGLNLRETLGMLIVTAGVLAVSVERFRGKSKSSKLG